MDLFSIFNISSEPFSAHIPSEPETQTRAGIPVDEQYTDAGTYDAGGNGFGAQGGGCLIA